MPDPHTAPTPLRLLWISKTNCLRRSMIGCKSIAHFNRQRSTDEETSRESIAAIDTFRADARRATG